MKPVKPDQRLWYRRSFELAPRKDGQRWLLHFGAVDWDATVFVNGRKLGEHRGGYDPFTFDITDALVPGGKQELVVSVWDPTDQGIQPRGKQVLKPGGIMYTANTGIWQTVWLEPVPVTADRRPEYRSRRRCRRWSAFPSGCPAVKAQTQIVARAFDGDREVAACAGRPGLPFALIRSPTPSSGAPTRPFSTGCAWASREATRSRATSACGRSRSAKDESGINRLFLNGKPLFQLGPLDQGWWPDGLYTAPTDEALKYDLDITKKLGFNMIRKHVKVEPDRWYYWCDKMGILVWQDMPSGDNKDDAAKKQFALELERMIDARRNHPSIVMWVPFNEGWGQHDTPRIVDWIKQHDPTRLVNNASGWTDTGTRRRLRHAQLSRPRHAPDREDPGRGARRVRRPRPAARGPPLGGQQEQLGLPLVHGPGELFNAYAELISRLRSLAVMGLCAAVYTQTTDCEVEVNGLMTYDRAVIKLPVEPVAMAHKNLFWPLPTIKVLLPTAQTSPQLWSYTIHAPRFGWMKPEFDDSAWPTGDSGFGTKANPRRPGSYRVEDRRHLAAPILRAGFEAASSPHLLIHHDEDAEVFVNGKRVAKLEGLHHRIPAHSPGLGGRGCVQAGEECHRRPLPSDRRRPVHRRRPGGFHREGQAKRTPGTATNRGDTLTEGRQGETLPSRLRMSALFPA